MFLGLPQNYQSLYQFQLRNNFSHWNSHVYFLHRTLLFNPKISRFRVEHCTLSTLQKKTDVWETTDLTVNIEGIELNVTFSTVESDIIVSIDSTPLGLFPIEGFKSWRDFGGGKVNDDSSTIECKCNQVLVEGNGYMNNNGGLKIRFQINFVRCVIIYFILFFFSFSNSILYIALKFKAYWLFFFKQCWKDL